MADKHTVLKVENLSVNYGYISALEGISLHVDQGEIITLIGSNGAGKTTTLMSISGLAAKAEGTVWFKGENITKMAPDRIVKMGMCHVPEGRKIFPALSVYENLIAGSLGNPSLTKNRIQELIEEQYRLFPRLKERIGQAGGSLSGGEQQMLAISRGLMMDPDIVMLDEPSLGLAPIIVEDIFELILKIRDMGKTILLIEQNASMALSIADRGYVLENGRIIMEGKGRELLADPKVKAAYLGA
ncbi:ABC transporter ATP-binding protein [Lachnoclostridium sp. An14]|uniref:ABC transporter ATP-binding protein n=1 Tax=Lachnoclostridium sp. An14 TaxID=1965562 RepID=UPI000B3745EA|nr:ABC transporter ATP-binding protein [Lachnoclostridium sp. An14]OUQ13975.1 ABC transporter ATP-binding protein [Lachnoclostridium sp. An14]